MSIALITPTERYVCRSTSFGADEVTLFAAGPEQARPETFRQRTETIAIFSRRLIDLKTLLPKYYPLADRLASISIIRAGICYSAIEMSILKEKIDTEIAAADEMATVGQLAKAFHHLERAHVLGQALTRDHTRVHWRMFKLGLRMRSSREVWGQFIRIIGAATKTPLGIYPTGNTGGSNVWFFKPMQVPPDLAAILDQARKQK
jgi:hypothetical protein